MPPLGPQPTNPTQTAQPTPPAPVLQREPVSVRPKHAPTRNGMSTSYNGKKSRKIGKLRAPSHHRHGNRPERRAQLQALHFVRHLQRPPGRAADRPREWRNREGRRRAAIHQHATRPGGGPSRSRPPPAGQSLVIAAAGCLNPQRRGHGVDRLPPLLHRLRIAWPPGASDGRDPARRLPDRGPSNLVR
jgi:hypothetical protein